MIEIMYLAMLLLLGTLISALASRLNISNVFFLIMAGMLLGFFNLVNFSNDAILTLSELALVLIVFDSTTRFNIKTFMKYSKEVLWTTITFFILVIFILGPFFMVLFFPLNENPLTSIFLGMLFSVLMYGTDPMVILSVFKGKNNKLTNFLEIESIINTPITIIFSLIALDFVKKGPSLSSIPSHMLDFVQQITIPVIVGGVIGFIIISILKDHFEEGLSHLTMLSGAVLSYALSESLGGNGVFGVTLFGLIFGNHQISHKISLEKYASVLTITLDILVFLLLGTIIVNNAVYHDAIEILLALLLFILLIVLRFIAVSLNMPSLDFKKRLFLSLQLPKGVDVAVVLFIIITTVSSIEGMLTVKSIILLFILFSVILSTVTNLFSSWFMSKRVP